MTARFRTAILGVLARRGKPARIDIALVSLDHYRRAGASRALGCLRAWRQVKERDGAPAGYLGVVGVLVRWLCVIGG
jgi:hypothetical protein